MTIRVILVDSHHIMLEALSSFLSQEPDIEVAGTANDSRAALQLAATLQPDVVVMDICMAGMNGIETTRRLVAQFPKLKVVALSALAHNYALEMLGAGACGYVLKENPGSELVYALRTVMKGKRHLCAEIVDVMVNHTRHSNIERPSHLCPREREVLQLLAEGGTSRAIANRLYISAGTVDVHRRNIMKKLGLHSVAELTKYAVRNGLTAV